MNKKGSWLALALSGVLALNLCTPVRAEDKPDEGTKKEETVYAFLDWQGQLKSATVSEWLHIRVSWKISRISTAMICLNKTARRWYGIPTSMTCITRAQRRRNCR